MTKKVFVSGCFDMLHSGHVAFFEEASKYGELYVGIGSDQTIEDLKGRPPVNPDRERLYVIRSLKYVKEAFVNEGSGLMDFEMEVMRLKPDIFFVNEDGHNPEKEKLCRDLGIEYIISQRKPRPDLEARSTTQLRAVCTIPYRIDLAGGWLDQPFVSNLAAGPVITVSIEPDYNFNDRSGMATSTRYKAMELWQTRLPMGDPEKLAYQLFCFENPPGTSYVSGSQDSLGILLPGLNQLYYEKGRYWPARIENNQQETVLNWLEQHIRLIPLEPRSQSYSVIDDTHITAEKAGNLSQSATDLWKAAIIRDEKRFGQAMIRSFEAQVAMFPKMMNKSVLGTLDSFKENCFGYKLSGAGGGGYLVLFTKEDRNFGLKIMIRRSLQIS